MWQELFELDIVLKLLFLEVLYEKGLNHIWKILYQRKEWVNTLRKEKQLLKKINQIAPFKISWLDLVNLYGYLIGEHVYNAQRYGLARKFAELSGNHPHQLWHTLKGFDVTIESGGHLASYYATYAIEGVCTFAYIALRSKNTTPKIRQQLLKELNQSLTEDSQKIILNEQAAIQQIHSIEELLKKVKHPLSGPMICFIVRYVRKIVLHLLPAVKNWIYTTYAEIDKKHNLITKRMSNRFYYGPLILPDFKLTTDGQLNIKMLTYYNYKKGIFEPEDKVSSFVKKEMLPVIVDKSTSTSIK